MIKSIIVDDDELSAMTLKRLIMRVSTISCDGVFTSSKFALEYINKNDLDLIFLDVEMPDLSGPELLMALKKSIPLVIIISSHKKYALDSYKLDALYFLSKPIDKSEFNKAILRAKEAHERQSNILEDHNCFFLKKNQKLIKINKQDILYVEALRDYVILHTNSVNHIVHTSMKSIEHRLSKKEFMRVHRSYIVKIDCIEDIEDYVISIGEKLIPIGKSYKKSTLERLNII